ncbi:dual specificity protein phosphatase family protein [Mesorhizobium sp. AR07]|nr:dual specificity protein phosphatase family protein [Mesorhizobium sp. AR07]
MGNPGTRRRRIAIWIASGAVALALTPAAAPHINNNFHTLVEGEAYRSAQPMPEEIRSYFGQHKIATIMNLRGPSPGSPWYDDELRTAKELGITHIDFAMSARRELTPQQVLQLVSIMKSAAKPLLIHCQAGADRTGLASALYMAEIAGQGEAASESQLSLRYGHYAIPLVGTWEMNLTWEKAEPFIGFSKS